MKKKLSIITAIILLTLTLLPTNILAAQEEMPPPPTEGRPSPHGNWDIVEYSKDDKVDLDFFDIQAVDYISYWGNSIKESGVGRVSYGGWTETYSTVDTLRINVQLQQWNGSNWVTISSHNYYRYNHYYLSNGTGKYVQRGKYYRVHTRHWAYVGSSYEYQTATSGYIYVS